MGKWKYVNWLVVLIILAHMYHYFSNRYGAHALVYVLATAGWLVLVISGYYVYVHRMNRQSQRNRKPMTQTALQKPPSGERPKVAFKKKH